MLGFIIDLTFMRTFLQYLINDFVLGDQIREVNGYGNKKTHGKATSNWHQFG